MRFNMILQPTVKTALAATLLAGGLGVTAYAQDYTPFTKQLGAPGVLSQQGPLTITFPLVRQDLSTLTIKLPGTASIPAAPESVAVGYLNIQAITGSPNTYFIDGSFPALAAELPNLEASLELAGLPIVAIADETAGISKPIFNVHVEGTTTVPSGGATTLAFDISTALQTIKSPQAKVTVNENIGAVFSSIPKKFLKITNNGIFSQVDYNAIVFTLPRIDVTPITIGTVVASPSVGVAQTVVISGNGSSVLTAELALIPKQVAPVLETLIAGGFTVSSVGGHFNNDSKRLTFVHAVATATDQNTFYQQAEQLGQALLLTLK